MLYPELTGGVIAIYFLSAGSLLVFRLSYGSSTVDLGDMIYLALIVTLSNVTREMPIYYALPLVIAASLFLCAAARFFYLILREASIFIFCSVLLDVTNHTRNRRAS